MGQVRGDLEEVCQSIGEDPRVRVHIDLLEPGNGSDMVGAREGDEMNGEGLNAWENHGQWGDAVYAVGKEFMVI